MFIFTKCSRTSKIFSVILAFCWTFLYGSVIFFLHFTNSLQISFSYSVLYLVLLLDISLSKKAHKKTPKHSYQPSVHIRDTRSNSVAASLVTRRLRLSLMPPLKRLKLKESNQQGRLEVKVMTFANGSDTYCILTTLRKR